MSPREHGFRLVERWEDTGSGRIADEFCRRGNEFRIWRRDLGWASFGPESGSIVATAAPGVDLKLFKQTVVEEWLPTILPTLGRQVLHASAAYHLTTRRVVAFSGPSGSGKSTLAFALGQADGFRQLADDVMAFRTVPGGVELARIPDKVSLRAPAAEFLGEKAGAGRSLGLPDYPLEIRQICFLRPLPADAPDVEIDRVSPAASFMRLLSEAFTPSIQPRDLRARLVEDFLDLVSSAQCFELGIPRRLAMLSRAVDYVAGNLLRR